MEKFYRLCIIAILLISSQLAFAQKDRKKDTRYGYHFRGKKQKFAKFPFDLHANLIVLKATLDDSDTLRFILDTGVTSTIVTDPKRALTLDVKYVRRVKITGAGEGGDLMANVSVGHTIRMGDIVATQQNIVVLDEDVLKLSEFLGVPIHGIFGHDIFSNFVVTIDFEHKMLSLTDPNKFKYKRSMGTIYPIVLTQSKPYTDAIAMVSNDNKEIPMRLVIDTGAGHALLLNASEKEPIQLPGKVMRANLGRGLNGEINGHIGRVDKIRMGSLEMKDILASFPDSLSFSMKFPPTTQGRQGSIGCELLRRFTVTLNYKDGYMILKPIKNRIKETFEHDMSGMDVRARGDQFNQYYINKVIENSPAYDAGLKEGDEIIFVNNQNVKDMAISEIYKILSRKEGKDVELFIRRKGELKFASFKLRRMI
ncbi:aspartyl protease family protein [Emticicia sp. BO119]|uniref:aspartyl protease family protein n=1 Tax=Emticicia sp. BO119 TaxID=2757768 RepID=UPI0015F02A91|nr:aspartyl protease family protein [Emticicia sp. BO119]MBA4851868.1 aspartyl protease family protein [Emticicia sp. BO119]